MSLRRSSQQILSFPGEEARELWQLESDGVWRLVSQGQCTVYGIPVLELDSSPFWSLGQDDGAEEAVALRWEGLGMEQGEGARLWTHWPILRKDRQLLLGTLSLAADSAATAFDKTSTAAARFEPSALLLPLPVDGVAVWREVGRCVAAFTRGGKLLHVTVLSARVLDADAAFELRDVFAALQAQDFTQTVATVRIWTACESDFAPQLACLFEDASVIKERRPDPRLTESSSDLLPAQVAARRREQRARQQKIFLLTAAAAVYVCFFAAWWLRLQWRASRLDAATAVVASQEPEIETIRQAQANWMEMETAIDPNLYPQEIYHQIVSLLPPEGIRLKEFEINGPKIAISGEATTVRHALTFTDKLKASEALNHYTWNSPVPSIKEDNRAEFRTTAVLNGGEAAQ